VLDVDFGTYPFVSSSSTVAGNVFSGSGLPPKSIDRVVGVYKAYITRVGRGPMPTELNNVEGDRLRERGHEYGTTTGRPRRCGWFDAVLGRFVARLNGLESIALTKLDVLDTFPRIKICTAYMLRGTRLQTPPTTLNDLSACEPIYEELPGWCCPTSDIRNYDDLPAEARRYIERIAELLETTVALVSVGPGRGQTIHCSPLL